MKFGKEVWIGISIFIVLIAFFFVFGGNITGNVAWEPEFTDNCSDSDVASLWDGLFEISSANIQTYREYPDGPSDCSNNFVAIKNDGESQIWLIKYDNSSGIIKAYYGKVNATLFSTITRTEDYSVFTVYYNEIMGGFLSGGVVANDVDTLDEFKSYFASLFKIAISDEMEYSVSHGGYGNIFTETISVGGEDYTNYYTIYNNTSFIIATAGFVNISDAPEVTVAFSGEIDDFTFERNSSWNDAFELDDYFSTINGVDFIINALGTNNTNGEWINYTIESGEVKFRPATGFLGSRDFNVTGNGVSSNNFNVTIVENVNDAPVLKKNIETTYVPRNGEEKLYLDVYFEDPDGDNMTYIVGGNNGTLDISISGNVLTLKLKSSFNESVKIYVIANDGKIQKNSNNFWVFEETELIVNMTPILNVTNNETNNTNLNITQNTTTTKSGSTSKSGGTGFVNNINSKWVLWSIVGLAIVGLILFLIWYFVLWKGNMPVTGNEAVAVAENTPMPGSGTMPQNMETTPNNIQNQPTDNAPVAPAAPTNPVSEYLKKLNMK